MARPGSDFARYQPVLSAVVACGCSVAWAALAGVASVTAGAITGSVALLAFGLDSVIDGSASAALVWRFRLELRRTGHPGHAERTAARVVAMAMLVAAVYVVAQAARSLITGAHPGHSVAGLVLLTGSLIVLPVLGYIKLRLAGQLQSRALRGDGVLSAAGAALAAVALTGLAVERSLGWWWADPAAASLIALFLLGEGWRTLSDPSSALQSPASPAGNVRTKGHALWVELRGFEPLTPRCECEECAVLVHMCNG